MVSRNRVYLTPLTESKNPGFDSDLPFFFLLPPSPPPSYPQHASTGVNTRETITSIASCAELLVIVFVTINPARYGRGPSTCGSDDGAKRERFRFVPFINIPLWSEMQGLFRHQHEDRAALTFPRVVSVSRVVRWSDDISRWGCELVRQYQ